MEDKIEWGIFKANLIPVLPKQSDRKRKQYTPQYSRVMDNAFLTVNFEPVKQTCIESASEY